MSKMRHDMPQLFGFIRSKLSRESEDELHRFILRYKTVDAKGLTTSTPFTYKSINDEKDPLTLWLAKKELHITTTASKNSAVVLLQAT